MIKIGWGLSAVIAVFMIAASVAPKLLQMEAALAPMAVVEWPAKYLVLIGVIELICTALFLYPRTAVLGGVLFTGLLGGALAANLRVDNPLFSHTLFSLYLGVAIWVALWLRDVRVRRVFPLM